MPINYKEYHPKWSLISRLIRFKRARNCCEECGIGNYLVIRNNIKDSSFEIYHYDADEPNYKDAKILRDRLNGIDADGEGKWTITVLTVAHLDHNKKNNRFWNLKALCQRDHLKHDIKHHCANRKYGRNHKGDHQLKLTM